MPPRDTHLRASTLDLKHLYGLIQPVFINTQAISHDWSEWAIDNETLSLVYSDEYDKRWNEKDAKFLQHLILLDLSWQVAEPFLPKTYSVGRVCVIGSRVELMVCVARLKRNWLFFSLVNEDPK